ncbi:MAG: HIT domain-containing protein [Parcubacteria group bacterium]
MTTDFYCTQVFSGKTPIKKVLETERVLAYHHTRPNWPVHIVIVPKEHIVDLLALKDNALATELLDVIKKVAAQVTAEHGAVRVLTNLGKYQDSKHLHFHVISGEPLPDVVQK